MLDKIEGGNWWRVRPCFTLLLHVTPNIGSMYALQEKTKKKLNQSKTKDLHILECWMSPVEKFDFHFYESLWLDTPYTLSNQLIQWLTPKYIKNFFIMLRISIYKSLIFRLSPRGLTGRPIACYDIGWPPGGQNIMKKALVSNQRALISSDHLPGLGTLPVDEFLALGP